MNETPAASSEPEAPPRSRARRVVRIVSWSAAGVIASLLIAVAVGAWLLGRETTLQRIVVEAERALGGQLQVTGVGGSLYDHVTLDRLVFRSKTQVITLEHGALRYAVAPLERRLTIVDARAARLIVETIAKSDEPTVEPETLELPASLRVDTLRLDAVHLGAIDLVADGRTTTITDADLRARYESRLGSKRWIVERIGVTTPWGKADGNLTLAATRPFAIEGRLVAVGKADGDGFSVPYSAPLAIGGRLADLRLASDFTVSDPASTPVAGHAEARVLPFREQPIDNAQLHVAGLSPKRWKAALPEADLSVDATIVPSTAPVVAGAGANPFTGTLRVVNRLPGPVDRDRIPVASLDADLQGDSLAIVASRLAADLGAAGKVSGKGSYAFARDGVADLPSFEGEVRALDLRAIQGTLIASRFAGPVSVSRREGVVRLDTTLTDTGRRVRLRGELAGQQVRIAEAAVTLGASRASVTGKVDLARDRPFDLQGDVAHLNPHDFGDFAKADLNAAFKLDGTIGAAATARSPQAFAVRGDIRVEPSRVL